MSDDHQQGTLAEVAQLRPGDKQSPSYVNFSFEALVFVGQSKPTANGGKMFPVTLTDPDDPRVKLASLSFDGKFPQYHGKRVRFSGKGMTRTEYNGSAQLGLGKNTVLEILGNGPSQPPTQQRREENRPPAQRNDAPATSTAPKALNAGFEAKAIELALELMHTNATDTAPGSEDFTLQVYTLSSDLVRIYDRLILRQLAKGPAERAKKLNGAPATEPPDQGGRQDPPPRPLDKDPEKEIPF